MLVGAPEVLGFLCTGKMEGTARVLSAVPVGPGKMVSTVGEVCVVTGTGSGVCTDVEEPSIPALEEYLSASERKGTSEHIQRILYLSQSVN
jgi:hypothetical protein